MCLDNNNNKVKTSNQLKTESILDRFQNKNHCDSACWQNVKRWTSESAEVLWTAWIKELEKTLEGNVGEMRLWANSLTFDNVNNNLLGWYFFLDTSLSHVTGRHWTSIVRRSFSSLHHCILFLLSSELKIIISYQFKALVAFSLKLKLEIFCNGWVRLNTFLATNGLSCSETGYFCH